MKREPYPRTGDEYFEYLTLAFNITYAMAQIIRDRKPNARVRPRDIETGVIHIDAQRLAQANPDSAVIFATLPVLGTLCIDGHHRAVKAMAEGREFLDAHVLSEAETRECCFTRSMLSMVSRKARRLTKVRT